MTPCLEPISNFSWITFKPDDKTLVVSTPDFDHCGYYSIVLIQSFEDFPDVNPYSRFYLDVRDTPIITIVQKPPYF